MDLVNFLFPRKCLECGSEGKYICNDCYCRVRPCNVVDKNNYSIFKYEGVIRRAIISLKYKFATDLTDELTDVCVQKLSTFHLPRTTVLVPIPLHKQRENWRGFNQAEIIGENLAKKMGWKYIPNLLIRRKQTTPQINLKGVDRRKNLSGVFVINPNILLPSAYRLILFDDVYTTGSTINEAKKVLSETGFKNIKSLTIAR